MESRGWFNKVRYLWLNEAEWLPLDDILHYEFADYHKPWFVPFAFNGAGDLWCWWPEASRHLVTPVVLCPHDEKYGEFYASDFLGFLYRQVLEYAVVGGFGISDEEEAREWLHLWHESFVEFFPHSWSETIMSIANKPLITHEFGRGLYSAGFIWESEYNELIKRHLAFPKLNEKFKWMI
jgi:hypothetical protein